MLDHTTEEAAALLGVTPGAVRLYISRKQIRANKRSGVNFITQEELDRFKRERKGPGQPRKQENNGSRETTKNY
jgi:Helix-turn-helix domain